MNEVSNTTAAGGSIGIWAIAIVILLALFGGGGFFGGNRIEAGYAAADCVTPKNVLDFGFYSMNNTNNKIDALATQNAQEFFNLSNSIKQNEMDRLRDELSQTRTMLAMEQQGRYMDAKFCEINRRLDFVPIAPRFFPSGGLNPNCQYPCPTTTPTA